MKSIACFFTFFMILILTNINYSFMELEYFKLSKPLRVAKYCIYRENLSFVSPRKRFHFFCANFLYVITSTRCFPVRLIHFHYHRGKPAMNLLSATQLYQLQAGLVVVNCVPMPNWALTRCWYYTNSKTGSRRVQFVFVYFFFAQFEICLVSWFWE